jgi:hypothetical protein
VPSTRPSRGTRTSTRAHRTRCGRWWPTRASPKADLASEVAAGRVTSSGVEADLPAAALELLRGNGSAGGAPVTRWVEHDDLLVDGVPVDWWVADGVPHAATSEGLARALAWAAGAWHLRHALAALLTDPAAAARLMLEDAAG